MKRIFTHLFVAVLLMLSSTSWAQFENGKVYRIVCSGTTSVSLGASALTDVAAVSTSETDKSQQWYVTVNGSDYTFRNLANGRYLLGNNGTSEEWGLTEGSNNFTVSKVNNNYCIRQTGHSNGYAYMHKDGGNNIVSWETSAPNTQWTPKEVAYTPEQLQTIWEEVESLVVPSETVSGYQTKLEAIFTDMACTQLNSTYAAKTVDQIKADANYLALPATLQAMVLKVRGGNWSENNAITGKEGWSNDYAKRFRVQMYEPYSIEGEITSYLRFNAHCNMDNPTGIYANSGEPIYIMVDGDIADGAELWVAHQTGLGATDYYNNVSYTQLHKGLNIVPYFNDASVLWINYLVHTYNASGATIKDKFPHKLSDYKPLKIHIEGGYINGYYNAMGDYRATAADGSDNLWGEVDNDEDWNYYKVRAPLNGTDAPNRDFPLLGHRQTLLFPLGQQANEGGGMEKGLLHHLDHIEVPTTPNCYGGSGNTFGTFADSYSGMNLNAENGKINIMLEAWDRIMYSELATMGLVSTSTMDEMNSLYPRWTSEGTAAEIYDYNGKSTLDNKTYKEFCQGIDYSEYFNHHGAGVGAPRGYMSGGWRVCNYHYNTMGSVIGKIAAEAGPTWGPAHEIGHQHQGVFNLNGQTEVTNNFFSNVAVWYMGMGTSRVNGNEGSLESVLAAFNTDGNDLYTNNIWAITHLYYRLWLYYHLAGNNTQFWPRLFELCRQVPLVNGGQISGETSLLRFYQHACDAAGEDLTEFFRAHGYFEIMDNRFVGDYSNATYNITQEQIDAAIKSVKDKGYPVNYAALLINDATSKTTVKHDGATKRSLWDGNATADLGSVNDFIDGEIESLTNYTAAVSADGTVTMSGGEGGIGFLVLNEDGELVSFSNKTEFALSDEATYLLATGKATIVAIDTDSKTAEAEVDLSAIQREMLEALIEKIATMPIDDGTYTHVGFYTKACAADLLAALESAKTVLASGTGFAAAYELLYTAKEKFVNSPSLSYVPFDPTLTYIITNYAYKDKTMHLSSGLHSATGVDKTLNTSKWQFKTTGTDGVYNLYNVSGKYLAAASKSTLVSSVSDQASAAKYSLIQDSPVGTWAISVSPAAEFATLHDNSHGNVVGWEAGASASKWYLTAIEGSTNSLATQNIDELQALIAKTETLVDLVGEISYTFSETPVALQVNDASGDYYVRTNATNTGGNNEGPIANLVDGNLGNYFHTQYANSAKSNDNLDHYIEVSMGNGALSAFKFSYTTRAGVANDYPQTIKVYGSNTENKTGDVSGYVLLATISSGLPASSTQTTYTYPSVIDAGIAYKYLRFMVPTTTNNRVSGGSEHNYWHMAEFDISAATATVTQREDYTSISAETILAAYNALNAAKSWVNYEKLTEQQLENATSTLQTAYKNLKDAYDDVLKVKKAELEALATATDAVIAQVGTVELGVKTPITLTASNLYCNQVDTNESGPGDSYIDRLIDGNTETYLHTTSTEGYLRIDLGENSTATAFKFSYTTRSNGNNRPTNIVVEGCNEQDGTYTTITELSEGLPSGNAAVYNSDIINMSQAYHYVRLRVTNAITNGANSKIFVMSEFSITTVKERNITIENAYDGIVSEDLLYSTYNTSEDSHLMAAETLNPTLAQLEAQIKKLTVAKATLEAVMNKVDKTELEELIEATTTLYNKMSDGNGNMNADYATSSLTAEQLTAVKDALDDAQSVVDYAGSTLLQVNEAKNALDEKYQVLVSVEDTNEKNSLATDGLTTLIGNVNTLLETIATEVASSKVPLPLTTTTGADYSITTAGVGDGSLANLIDKNADGTGNTGTYYGSLWQGGVEAYSQYIEVDLGSGIALDELSFDYTTRDSGHSTERPKVIKLLGSNDKSNYVEIKEFKDGMPVGRCQQWTMVEMFELAARYRYIRFSVDSDNHSFHMSDFNVYTNIDYAVPDYYTTATDLDFVELCIALQSAEDLLTRDYITTAQYNAVYEKLNTCYTTANNVVNADVKVRTNLEKLISDTETLIDEVATVTKVETPVLSSANVYCNADNSTNSGANLGDKRGVDALFDGDVNTHLHTTYDNNEQDDDLDHYIRIDMGEGKAVQNFSFNYIGRSSNSNNDPSTIVVQACNKVDGDWVTVETLTGLPTDGDKVEYTSPVIEMDQAYRYVRFMVTETQNNSTTTYNEIAHKFFVMSEFGFTAYNTVILKDGYADVDKGLVEALYNEKELADVVNDYYMTNEAYNSTLAGLQAAYDALNDAKNKAPLKALINATASLKSSLYDNEAPLGEYVETEIALQCETDGAAGYLYCNAPETNSGWSTDNAGVAGCIDLTDGNPNLGTFLHTEYGGDQSADGLDHYLRVDLGEGGAAYVEFGYVGRSGHLEKSPKTVVVAATNDLNGEWTTIKNLTMEQPSATQETRTGAVGNGVAYRYWRFMVTDTHFNGQDGNGHKFFALSDFNVYRYDAPLKSEYTPNIYIYETNVLVAEVETAISAATAVYDDAAATAADCDNAIAALQPVHDKLAEAIELYWCPVALTTDVTNPALYTIDAVGRGDSKAWQYNAQNNNITIVNKDASNLYHLWYFMLGGEEQTVKIIPVMTPEYGLSATDFGNGAGKVSAVAEYSVDWSFAFVNNYWNFKPYGKNPYLSHFGGGGNALGFFGSADGGSYVNFTAVKVKDYALTRLAKLAEGKSAVTAGTTVGSYDEATGGVYNEVLEAANGMVAAASSMPQEYVNAFTRLFNANNGLRINLPDPAKFYALRCNHEGRYIYVNADNKLQWASSSYDKAQSRAVWQFEEIDASNGTCKMKSLHTQSYLSGTSGSQWAFGETGKVVTLAKSPNVDGAVIFKIEGNGNNGLHAHGANNTVISYTNDAGANHYFFEEVADLTTIKHTVTMNATFSSVMLGYNATVPAGVEAYNAEGVADGYVTLVKLEGGVIPANTPVILYRTDDNPSKTFTYTTTDANTPTKTVLGGSLYQKFVECDVDKDYYKLMIKSGEAKMYWMYKEFNAEGNYGENDVLKGTDNGGHIKCSANKIYMALPSQQQAASYGMRFKEPETTSVDEVKTENGNVKTIYDLQGRKLTEITQPGFYIINGKKVYVK